MSPFLDVAILSMPVSFVAQLGSGYALPIECSFLTYDLNSFKYRINRHPLSVGSFWTCMLWSFCTSVSCNSMPCSGYVQNFMEWIPIKKRTKK